MFSGIGGFEYGIEEADKKMGRFQQEVDKSESGRFAKSIIGRRRPEFYKCVGCAETDKYASAIYRYHYNHKNYGDATLIEWDAVPDFDILVGGFPCQSFSIAGKRRGFDDTRGTLFFEIERALRAKRPRYFLLENVKGLLSSDGGRTITTIIKVLTNIDYRLPIQGDIDIEVLPPQNRERVFIVGHLRGTSRPQVFPIRENGAETSAQLKQIPCERLEGYNEYASRVYDSTGIARAMTGAGGNCNDKTGQYLFGTRIRRLTPKEAERLQGFNDGYTEYGDFDGEIKPISDTQRYKCLGNAVTTTVITEIAKRLFNEVS